jgi:hypothetical protein
MGDPELIDRCPAAGDRRSRVHRDDQVKHGPPVFFGAEGPPLETLPSHERVEGESKPVAKPHQGLAC